jgi:hypothetical protein
MTTQQYAIAAFPYPIFINDTSPSKQFAVSGLFFDGIISAAYPYSFAVLIY